MEERRDSDRQYFVVILSEKKKVEVHAKSESCPEYARKLCM